MSIKGNRVYHCALLQCRHVRYAILTNVSSIILKGYKWFPFGNAADRRFSTSTSRTSRSKVCSLARRGCGGSLPSLGLSFFLLHAAGFQGTLEAATTWPLNCEAGVHGTRTASADQEAWRTRLAATSTSITAPSALNPVFFHRRPQRCDPFKITALACTRSSCFRDRIINRTVPARAHSFLDVWKQSRYFDPPSRFFSPAIIFTIWMRSSWNVEACRIEAILLTEIIALRSYCVLISYKKMCFSANEIRTNYGRLLSSNDVVQGNVCLTHG